MVEPPAEPLTVSPAPAEAPAPDEQSATSRSHFRRWYLRPWFLLLLAILLPLGTFCWQMGMRYRAFCVLTPLMQGRTFVMSSFLRSHLEFLPECLYGELWEAWLILPDDPEAQQHVIDQLRWFPEVSKLGLVPIHARYSRLSDSANQKPVQLRLPTLTTLEALNIYGLPLDEPFFSDLHDFPQLRALSLYRVPLSAAAVQKIGELTSLEALEIRECGLTDEMLLNLSKLHSLTLLSLSESELTDRGLAVISGYHRLQFLSIGGAKIGAETMSRISELPLLQLRLWSVEMDDEALAAFSAEIPSLRVFEPNSELLTERSLDVIANHRGLVQVHITGSKISTAAAVRLRSLNKLRSLRINSCEIELPIAAVPKCQ